MNATRALRDYLKHERTISPESEAVANTFCMCIGFLFQSQLDFRRLLVILDELETEMDIERGKTDNTRRFRFRMLLIRPGKATWNTVVRSIV